jgi:hypothetical protein
VLLLQFVSAGDDVANKRANAKGRAKVRKCANGDSTLNATKPITNSKYICCSTRIKISIMFPGYFDRRVTIPSIYFHTKRSKALFIAKPLRIGIFM